MNINKKIVMALLDSIELTESKIQKIPDHDPTVVHEDGVLTAVVESMTPLAPDLPDYFVDVVIYGMTQISQDRDGSVINSIHADIMHGITMTSVDDSVSPLDPPAEIVGIITEKVQFSADADQRYVAVHLRLAITNLYF